MIDFYNYTFPSKVKSLEDYLKVNNIIYNKTEDTITFDTNTQNEVENWIIYYKRNAIISITMYCNSSSMANSDLIRDNITKNLVFDRDDSCSKLKIYHHVVDGKKVYVNVESTQVFRVCIYPEYKKSKLAFIKDDIFLTILFILLGILGVGISVLFIILYNVYHNDTATIVTGILSALIMYISLIVICVKSQFQLKESITTVILLPLFYVGLLFGLFCLLFKNELTAEVLLSNIMWSIYLMPSFVVVIAFMVLFVLGLNYW